MFVIVTYQKYAEDIVTVPTHSKNFGTLAQLESVYKSAELKREEKEIKKT